MTADGSYLLTRVTVRAGDRVAEPARIGAVNDAGEHLVERVRTALAGDGVTERKMFGGVSFMVDDSMLVSVRGDGTLLVRADPDRNDELLARPGASQAMMGERSMGPSWIDVAAESIATDEALQSWLTVARHYHERHTAT